MAKITLIIPIYNVEKYLSKCLESILNQSYKKIEILCINDGSTDRSPEIVKKYQKTDSRIHLINKENGGYGSVLEYAIKQMKTPYFMICDPDDWLEPKCVEKLLEQAISNNTDLVIADRYEIYKKNLNKKIKKANLKYALYKMNPYQKYTQKELQKFAFYIVSPHAKLYKTALLKNVKFPKKTHYTDYLLYIYALKKAKSALYINEFLANYYIDRPGNSLSDRNISHYLFVWKETIQHLEKSDKYLLYRMYIQLKYILRELGDKEKKKNALEEIYKDFETLHQYNLPQTIEKKAGIDIILIRLFWSKKFYKITCFIYLHICHILLIIKRSIL